MRLLERLPRESARDYAIRVIRDNIVRLELEPGLMVSENDLSERLGLSRTPVREALIELSKSGIVEIYPQHGSKVSLIDYSRIAEATFTRQALEAAVVMEACDVAGPEDLRILDENLMLQDLYLKQGDAEKLLGLDNAFHRQLFLTCRKMLSYELMNSLTAHFDRVRHLSLNTVKNIRIVEDHRGILAAIRARDKEEARRRMVAHLTRYTVDKADIQRKYARYFSD